MRQVLQDQMIFRNSTDETVVTLQRSQVLPCYLSPLDVKVNIYKRCGSMRTAA